MHRTHILFAGLIFLLTGGVVLAQQTGQARVGQAPAGQTPVGQAPAPQAPPTGPMPGCPDRTIRSPDSNRVSSGSAVSLPDYFYRHLTGTIGGEYPIVMNLMRTAGHLVGDYYQADQGIPLFFDYASVISKGGDIHLEARNELGKNGSNQVLGVFDGRFVGRNEVCGTWTQAGSSKKLPFALSTVGVSEGPFDVEHLERSYYDRSHGSATMDAIYPVMRTASAETDAAFNANVVSTVVGLYQNGVDEPPPTTVSQAMREFIQAFTSQLGESSARTYFPPWSYSITAQILFNSAGIVSLRYEAFSFEGGAHPNTVYTNSSYVRATGSVITLDDLLRPGYQQELNRIGLEEFRRDHGIKPGESLPDAGYFVTDNAFQLNQNFLITQAGLLFQFNQYEIAPYYYGAQQVLIPYSDLRGLLLPTSPIASLVSGPAQAAAGSGDLSGGASGSP